MNRRLAAYALLAAASAPALCGCQAGVMIGRILFGDPEIRPAFELQTGVRLDEQEEAVRVVCTSPSQLAGDGYAMLNIDLPEQLLRRLKRRGVPVGSVERALSKLDDLGGQFDARAVAGEYEDGYLVHVHVDRFGLREPGSNMYRGHCEGALTVYQVLDEDGEGPMPAGPVEVFSRGFGAKYPTGHPVPGESTPEGQFRRKFVAHLAGEAARMLVRYRVTETF